MREFRSLPDAGSGAHENASVALQSRVEHKNYDKNVSCSFLMADVAVLQLRRRPVAQAAIQVASEPSRGHRCTRTSFISPHSMQNSATTETITATTRTEERTKTRTQKQTNGGANGERTKGGTNGGTEERSKEERRNGGTNGGTSGGTNERRNERTEERTNGGTNEGTKERTKERMNERTNGKNLKFEFLMLDSDFQLIDD